MNKNFYIEIHLKKNFFDAFGDDLKKSIIEMGITGINNIYVSDIYFLQGEISKKEMEKIAKNLFLDSITQTLTIYTKPPEVHNKKIIEVWYKKQVSDPVSITALKGIKDMGINKNIQIRCGKKYQIDADIDKDITETICKKLIANTLIQDYRIS
jgi:phosphoribosylformylglycinamidine synthase